MTSDQLQAALNRFGLGQLLAAEPATSANVGQNLSLTTDHGEYVLRGNPYVEGQLAHEQHFAIVFHDRPPVIRRSGQKFTRITTRRGVGLPTSRYPAAAKM